MLVLGSPDLVHVDRHHGMGMQPSRRQAVILRRDEQHGRGQWRVQYQDGRQDVVAEGRLELDPDAIQEDVAA